MRGTCQWVLQHPHYLEWYEKIDSAILWVSADPGCGKSVLTKSLIENELHVSPFRVSCYFFFKDDNEDQRSATHALCAILHQLFSQRPQMLRHAMHKYSENGSTLKNNFELLWEIFQNIAMDLEMVHTEIVCLLDALDECSEIDRGYLLKVITTFVGYQQKLRMPHAPLKFFLTSRPVLSIEVHFSKLVANLPTVRLAGELETKRISSEVELFIQAEIEDMQIELGFDSETAMSLQNRFSKFENRTYLWLKLIIDLIRYDPDLATKDGRRRIFDEIPDSVDEAYSAILNKSKDKKQTRKLLAIICVAPRPLTVQEMTIALKIENRHKSVDDFRGQSHEFCKRWIRNLCGLFVSVIDDRIYLLHQTAKEFLLSPTHTAVDERLAPRNELWKHSLVGEDCRVLLSRILLLVILTSNFGNDNAWWSELASLSEASLVSNADAAAPQIVINTEIREWVKSTSQNFSDTHFGYSIFEYASQCWATLLQGISTSSTHEIIDLVWRACDVNSSQCKDWWLIYTCGQGPSEPLAFCHRSEDFTPLHLASILNLDFLFPWITELPGVELNARDRASNNSPVWWAALHDSQDMLSKLLDHPEVDVNFGCDSVAIHMAKVTTPLLAAVWKRHHTSVKLLLSCPTININAQNPDGSTALLWAARTWEESIVDSLLASPGIDVNLSDCEGWSPLARVVSSGKLPLVEKLLDFPDINPNCQTGYGDTPLMLAAMKAWSDGDEFKGDNEWIEVMQVLMKHKKTDVNIIARAGYTALSTAAGKGRTKAMEILFTAPALEVNLKGPSGTAPLSYAVSRGQNKAIILLLSHPDIDVNVQDHEGRTALFLAVFYAYTPALKLLLAAEGIDATIRDHKDRTPLEIARENVSLPEWEWRQRRHDRSVPGWNCFRDIIDLLQPPSSQLRDASEVIDDSASRDPGPFELQGTDSWLGTVFMPCELP